MMMTRTMRLALPLGLALMFVGCGEGGDVARVAPPDPSAPTAAAPSANGELVPTRGMTPETGSRIQSE